MSDTELMSARLTKSFIPSIQISGHDTPSSSLNGRGGQLPCEAAITTPRPAPSKSEIRKLKTRISRKHRTLPSLLSSPFAEGRARSARDEFCSVLLSDLKASDAVVVKYIGSDLSEIEASAARHEYHAKWRDACSVLVKAREVYKPVPVSRFQAALRRVSEAHEVSISDIMGESRDRKFAHARQEVYAILNSGDNPMSFSQIGQKMNRVHATIMHGVKSYNKRQKEIQEKEKA